MTARPFSRFEPIAIPDDPARAIAAFFSIVALIGAIPGLCGAFMLAAMFVGSLTSAVHQPGAPLAFALALAYAGLGFRQLLFYLRRATGSQRGRPDVWWASTYLFNLVPLGLSIAATINEPHIGAVASTLWFAVLCTLAVVAYAADSRGVRRALSESIAPR